jgi:hypothetical protein
MPLLTIQLTSAQNMTIGRLTGVVREGFSRDRVKIPIIELTRSNNQ